MMQSHPYQTRMKKMKNKNELIAEISGLVEKSNTILILGHVSPDGDCFGSMAALGMEFIRKGKTVRCAAGDGLTYKYEFIRDYIEILSAEELYDLYKDTDFDLVITVDTADKYRVGSLLEKVFDRQKCSVAIDHHITNPCFSNVNWIEDRSSASELVYEYLVETGADISVRTANVLFAGIMTDTGNFTYSNTTSKTFEIAAELVKYGAETSFLAEEIDRKRTLGATLLVAHAIDTMTLHHDNRIAVMSVSYDEIYGCGALPEDCENLINFARDIDSVEIAVLIREINPLRHKVSLRSKKYADVAKFAACFGGGGHKHAAGCTLDGTTVEIKKKILEEAEKLI